MMTKKWILWFYNFFIYNKKTTHTIIKCVNSVSRSRYDFSTKPYEILVKTYIFDKEFRNIKNLPKWRHCKYYQTYDGANQAIKTHRTSRWEHSNIIQTITIKRFKVIKRDFNNPYN